jgi:hypothetical protein
MEVPLKLVLRSKGARRSCDSVGSHKFVRYVDDGRRIHLTPVNLSAPKKDDFCRYCKVSRMEVEATKN